MENRVLSILASASKPLTLSALAGELRLPRRDRSLLAGLLEEMASGKKIWKKGKRYTLPDHGPQVQGSLEVTAKGFGFVTADNQLPHEKDIFIAAANLNNASHGDQVLVTITRSAGGRREGRIVKVVSRAHTSLCGIFNASGSGGFVTPDNNRLPYTVLIAKGHTLQTEDGTAVVVEITDYGAEGSGPKGEVTRLLGDPFDAGVQTEMAIRQQELRDTFPDAVQAEAEQLHPLTTSSEGRQDLQHIPHVTIDGADARDFDDAIAVEATDVGFTLYVSIADVSHYVSPGSAIDREAYLRGTSVYLPDRVLPMLPERLSNDLCSLVPDEVRPAFTAILAFDHQGKRTGSRYTRSLIRSHHRFTYTTVQRLLYEEDPELQQEHSALLPMLEGAKALAVLLHRQRMERGSLGFNIPEPTICLRDGKVQAITLHERNQAHQLIEECMLAANEAVAETLENNHRRVLYRIHEEPDPIKVESFLEVCKALGVELPKSAKTPAWFAAVIETTAGTPREYVINNLLLRTMQQARYAPENSGHFGLAATHYLHFTSPIRRYPDLIAHRALAGLLARAPEGDRLFPASAGGQNLTEAGKELSRCERTAIEAERDVHSRLSAVFMHDKVGQQFTAVISGVTSFGLFVELEDCFVSGAVPVASMDTDYFLHDAKRHRLIGERTNRIYQLGDTVEVALEEVNILSKRLTFSLKQPALSADH